MKKWTIWGIILYVHSAFLLYKGIDRIEGYNFDEVFPEENVYAYVGNDADNFIINANLSAGHFALAGAFILAGTILIATGAILKRMNETQVTMKEMQMTQYETQQVISASKE